MPASPNIKHGALPDYDLDELAETGLFSTGIEFKPRSQTIEKKGHTETVKRGIVQVQVYREALDIDLTAEPVPTVEGLMTGLANAHMGYAATLVHFAEDGLEIHGYTRDNDRLLMVREVTRTLALENIPVLALSMSYYPDVDLTA
jgi:hypothetical protein